MTVKMLAYFASTDEHRVSAPAVYRMLGYLLRHGYLEKVMQGQRRMWRLLPSMNTGPLPPILKGNGGVFDRNLKKIMPLVEVQNG